MPGGNAVYIAPILASCGAPHCRPVYRKGINKLSIDLISARHLGSWRSKDLIRARFDCAQLAASCDHLNSALIESFLPPTLLKKSLITLISKKVGMK